MTSLDDFCRLSDQLAEASIALQRAMEAAAACEGGSGGRAPCPEMGDPGEPAVEGSPEMADLFNRLHHVHTLLQAAITPELRKAFEDAEAEWDRLSDLADGASY